MSERTIAMVIWAALAGGVVLLLGATFFLPPFGPPDPELANVFLPVSAVLSAVTVASSWLFAVRFRPPAGLLGTGAGPPSPGQLGRTRLVVAAALCEGSALTALVFFLTTRDARLFLPFALSFGSLLSHFPGDRHWARLCRVAGGDRGPRPMMRE